jgi:maleate cis-trans isomerase
MAHAPTALLIVPANNTTMAGEMERLCPEIGRFHVAGVKRGPGLLTLADLPSYRDSTIAAVEPFLGEAIDLVVYGCTAAGFIGGPEGNAAVVDALAERCGVTVVSTAGAMIDALRHDGVRRVDVVTPYLDAVNDGLRRYLAAEGFAVAGFDSFFCPDVAALGRVTAEEVATKALTTAADGDALFIACSQLPTLPILGALRDQLRRPVWSSVHATAWASLAALDLGNAHLAKAA